MNIMNVQVALSAPERELFDIIYNNVEPVQMGDKIVQRFRMHNGELKATFQRLDQTFFDSDEGDARGAMEECVNKLLSTGCVRLIGRRKDAEPPGVLQIERPRDRIEIVDRIVEEQQEQPQQEEEQMAVTNEAVVDFLKQKRQELIDAGNEQLQTLFSQIAEEKKKLGEGIAAGEEVDASQYNALRKHINDMKEKLQCLPLPQAFDQVIQALKEMKEEPKETLTAVEPAKTVHKPRQTANSKFLNAVKILAADPHFSAGGEGTVLDALKILKANDPNRTHSQQDQVSKRLHDAMKAGYVEMRKLSGGERKNAGKSSHVSHAFKLTEKGMALKT